MMMDWGLGWLTLKWKVVKEECQAYNSSLPKQSYNPETRLSEETFKESLYFKLMFIF